MPIIDLPHFFINRKKHSKKDYARFTKQTFSGQPQTQRIVGSRKSAKGHAHTGSKSPTSVPNWSLCLGSAGAKITSH